jgi:hypothetical protein
MGKLAAEVSSVVFYAASMVLLPGLWIAVKDEASNYMSW